MRWTESKTLCTHWLVKKILVGALLSVAIVTVDASFLRTHLETDPSVTSAVKGVDQILDDRMLQAEEQGVDPPSIAWFYTFPESGSTYIMHLFQLCSGRSTGSNYGSAMIDEKGGIYRTSDSIPVYSDFPGPHYCSNLPAPKKFVLTKTHSYGTCFDCPPWKYLGPTAKLRHMKINMYASKMSGGVEETLQYSADHVKKILIMYRDPMDIAVARYFHRVNRANMPFGNQNFASKYALSPNGFWKYCRVQDSSFQTEREKNWYHKKGRFWGEASQVPCRAEFVKIFEFYNMAEKIKEAYNLEEMRVSLKDFALNFDDTAKKTLNFLEEEYIGLPDEEILLGDGERQFSDFFDEKEHRSIAILAKKMCLPAVWNEGFGPFLQKYI